MQQVSWHAYAGTGRIQSERYCLLPGDLRDAPAIQQALIQAGLQAELPTLVLAECVLVYMEPQHSAELLRSLGRLLPTAACVVYEQIRPHDAFGQQMLRNLQVSGARPPSRCTKVCWLTGSWVAC